MRPALLGRTRTDRASGVGGDRGPGADADVDELRTRLLVGAPPSTVAAGLPARAARAVSVAAAVGAPAVPALDAALAARADDLRRERALAVATAQARTVAAGLAALPLVAVTGLGALLELDLWSFYTSGVGALVGAAGAGLAALGVAVSWRIVANAGRRPRPVPPHVVAVVVGGLVLAVAGVVAAVTAAVAVYLWRRSHPRPQGAAAGADEVADLLATAVTGGYGTAAALRVVADALPDHGPALRRAALAIDLGQPPALPVGLHRITTIIGTSARWGAPAGPSLRAVAADLRGEELARSLAAAERLPALLAFPTALCLLPACVLLVGAPLVAEGIRAASGT